MAIKEAICKLISDNDLTEKEMVEVMEQIMTGGATDAQIGSFLTALRIKGETVDEITGAARVMREKATTINAGAGKIVDTCGSGGDGASTFNISTTAAFVTAGAGLTVAKHGNRAVSSKAGSADTLKALGVDIEASVEQVEKSLNEVGIGFLFAPLLHGAMKYAIGPRREIGVRTVFNILGPLTNPAGAKSQVIGLYDRKLIAPIAHVLANLGSEHVFVVHGADGLDEATVTGETYIAELKNGEVKEYTVTPEDFGLEKSTLESIKGGDAETNATITRNVLKGKKGAQRDITVLNAALAICAGGVTGSVAEGVRRAEESIDSGAALGKLEGLTSICQV